MKHRVRAVSLGVAVFAACIAAASSLSATKARTRGVLALCTPPSASAAQAPRPGATVFSAAEMAAAFAKGKALFNKNGMRYLLSTGRRDSPGEVEVHTHYTDVIYITEGEATFITGGRMIQGKTIAPGEIRGNSIRGGVSHPLEKGSLVIVPAGVPHWFKAVRLPIVDLVIKVRTN